MNKDASQSKQAKPRDQALDLVLMIHPRELDKATVRSLLAESLAACDGKQLAALDEPLEALRKSHPDDLSVAIATALRAWPGMTRSGLTPPSSDCLRWLKKHHSNRCPAAPDPIPGNVPRPRG